LANSDWPVSYYLTGQSSSWERRIADRGHVRYDWQHYIALVDRKPGALRNGAPFADMPAPLRQLKLGLLRHEGGDRVMAQMLAAVPVAGLEAVLVAVNLVIESGALSAEHVLNVLARLTAAPGAAVQSGPPTQGKAGCMRILQRKAH
jgi:hypothetical protein